jgi:hypothetical protein
MLSDAPKDTVNDVTSGPKSSGKNPSTSVLKVSDDEKRLIAERDAEEKTARLLLYRRDDVRRLVGWMLKGHDEIRPQRSSETGLYVFSGAEFGLGDISTLLTELEYPNILQKTAIDTVPSCPDCRQTNFHVVYVCPYSQHTTLEHGTMIEHYACGNADFEERYRSGPNELICPKCRRTLKLIGTDYRKVERAYRCTGCGRFFGTPKLTLPCRNCGRKNDEEELVMEPIFAYKINEQFRSELVSHCSLEANVISVFEKSGFKVTAPIQLQGLSGVLHNFDLGAKRGDSVIVLDMVSAPNEVGPQDVVEFFAKIYDTKPSKALLIAMPRLNREAQRLGAMYGVEVIGAESPDEVVKRLTSYVGGQSIVETRIAGPNVEPNASGLHADTGAEPKIDQVSVQREQKPTGKDELSKEPTVKRNIPVEPKAAVFIDQAVSSLEKKISQIPSDDSSKADELLNQARLRMEQTTQKKPSEDKQSEEEDTLRQARERMKRLIKEADHAVA